MPGIDRRAARHSKCLTVSVYSLDKGCGVEGVGVGHFLFAEIHSQRPPVPRSGTGEPEVVFNSNIERRRQNGG